jgi:3-hydroxyacyl-[acyl-carrier-protein] dehydratase
MAETAERKSRFEAPLDALDIMKLLPHRHPFLLVDQVLELEPGNRVKAVKTVSSGDFWVPGHFPDNPVMPGVLMIEAIAQAGGIMVLSLPENTGKTAVLGGVDSIRVRRMVRPGDVMTIDVEAVYAKMGAFRVKGTITVGKKTVMTGEVIFKSAEL